MPIPALVGSAWFASLLGGLFASLFNFFGKFVTRSIAVVAVAITLTAALFSAFFLAISGLLNGLDIAIPSQYAFIAGHVLPQNTVALITIIVTVRVMKFILTWKLFVLESRQQSMRF